MSHLNHKFVQWINNIPILKERSLISPNFDEKLGNASAVSFVYSDEGIYIGVAMPGYYRASTFVLPELETISFENIFHYKPLVYTDENDEEWGKDCVEYKNPLIDATNHLFFPLCKFLSIYYGYDQPEDDNNDPWYVQKDELEAMAHYYPTTLEYLAMYNNYPLSENLLYKLKGLFVPKSSEHFVNSMNPNAKLVIVNKELLKSFSKPKVNVVNRNTSLYEHFTSMFSRAPPAYQMVDMKIK